MSKKEKTNPIENAVGKRGQEPPQEKMPPFPIPDGIKKARQQILAGAAAEISDSEMMNLEGLQAETEERLQARIPETTPSPPKMQVATTPGIVLPPPGTEESAARTGQTTSTLVPKPGDQFVIENSSQESPQSQTENEDEDTPRSFSSAELSPFVADAVAETQNELGAPAEEKQLVALKEHIASQGFNIATVGAHINILCSQPMVVPSITTWGFRGWHNLPEAVYLILVEPGFLDAIYPALKIVMGSNIGNVIWTSSIATTLAFFSIIQTLPFVLEAEKAKNEKDS